MHACSRTFMLFISNVCFNTKGLNLNFISREASSTRPTTNFQTSTKFNNFLTFLLLIFTWMCAMEHYFPTNDAANNFKALLKYAPKWMVPNLIYHQIFWGELGSVCSLSSEPYLDLSQGPPSVRNSLSIVGPSIRVSPQLSIKKLFFATAESISGSANVCSFLHIQFFAIFWRGCTYAPAVNPQLFLFLIITFTSPVLTIFWHYTCVVNILTMRRGSSRFKFTLILFPSFIHWTFIVDCSVESIIYQLVWVKRKIFNWVFCYCLKCGKWKIGTIIESSPPCSICFS